MVMMLIESSSSSPSFSPLPASLLPNEILAAIFEHLSRHALTIVVRVSRHWRGPAERILYTTVQINKVLPRTSPVQLKGYPMCATMPSNTLCCCETLSKHAHLAEVVRKFHIRWHTESVESPAFLLLIAQNIIRTLVPSFIHLESLELALGLAAHPPPLVDYFSSRSLPLLRNLSLGGLGGSPEPVLRNHPNLRHFKLADHTQPLRLHAEDLPHLLSFRGSPVVAASVLPGRPVQTLTLIGFEFVTEADLERIAQTTVPIRALDLSGMSVTPTLLRDVSRHLPHVEVLKVRLALRHTLHFALSGIHLLTGLTTVLGAFHDLKSLDFSPTNAVDGAALGTSSGASEEAHLCAAWAQVCPSLRRVTFPSKTEWTNHGGRGMSTQWTSEGPAFSVSASR
ncbi:hypothetical protein OF83DRAFT_1288783 [Amylostereum chailletii]|nr:hypothetical protein OF83DRAFT_1288783 [Amylostereum chailletii]